MWATDDPQRRLTEHNSIPLIPTRLNTGHGFESCLACSDDIKIARRIEKFIKNQRSRKLIEQLIDPIFNPTGVLAQLVRVPDWD